jgi:hypothetical protein
MKGNTELLEIINLIKAISDRQSFNVRGYIDEINKGGTYTPEPEYDGYDLQTRRFYSDGRRPRTTEDERRSDSSTQRYISERGKGGKQNSNRRLLK